MPTDDRLDVAFHVRASQADLDRIESLRSRLQEQMGPQVRVTQRTVLLVALERLEAYLAKLDAEKAKRARGKGDGQPTDE